MRKYLSICIPSYNRYEELKRLLYSIDAVQYANEIEIIVREDCSPNRKKIREVVNEYSQNTAYDIRYIENEENYGYDKNIRNVAKVASSKWVMYMGDDDSFIPNALDCFISYLHNNESVGYVLRRYQTENKCGRIENYRYSNKNEIWSAGEDAIVELFRRSVFISGFTFQKDMFTEYDCEDYDGTLLFQLYILSCICLENKSGYCDIAISKSIEGGVPYFGSSKSENKLYSPGDITYDNSINFLKQVRLLSESFDRKNGTYITDGILKSYSKYSYGYLLEHRSDGVRIFCRYAREIKEIGLGDSFYFYIYFVALLLLGKDNCQNLIRILKTIIGHTPRL